MTTNTPSIIHIGPHACVQRHHDTPTLLVNGEPAPPMWMTIAGLAQQDDAYLRALGEAGLRVFFLEHYLYWNGDNALDRLSELAELTLRCVPEAWLMLRTGLYPPLAWMEAHPEEVIQFADGTPADTWFGAGTHTQALCSRAWRDDQTRQLDHFLPWLAAQPFSARVIGFFLNAGGTGEWYIPVQSVQGDRCIDHSLASRVQFSDSLREAYGSDDALRAAWQRTDVTLAAPPIPTCADQAFLTRDVELFAHYHGEDVLPPAPATDAAIGAFCNPDTHRHVAEYYRAINEGTADSIIHFARFLKTRTGGDKVVGAFFGGFGSCMGGVGTAVTHVLDSGVVDFLASPGDYPNRQPGGDTALHNIQDAYRLRDTLYVVEEDTRTVATALSHDWGVNTLGESIEVMKRNFGRNLAEDLSAWWFDMGISANRWYRFPKMLQVLRRQQDVAHAFYRTPRAPKAEIAFLYDQHSQDYTCSWTLADLGYRLRTWEIHRIGAPVACHYLDDLNHPAMPDYRLYVFVNAFAMTNSQRASITRALAGHACTALWLYAPGIINPDATPRFNVENVSALTGIKAEMRMDPALPYCRLTPAGAALLPDIRPDWDYGWFADRESFGTVESWLQPQGMAQFTLLCPYLSAADPAAEVLMRFTTDDRPAMAMTTAGATRTVVAYFKALRADIIRGFARLSGCHLYSDSDDVLYASPHFVTIHAGTSGEKIIHLPELCNPYEIYQRAHYGQATRELRVRLRKGETRTFYLHGEI